MTNCCISRSTLHIAQRQVTCQHHVVEHGTGGCPQGADYPSWPVQTCYVISVHGAFPAQVETPIAGGGLLSALVANMPTIGQDSVNGFNVGLISKTDLKEK